jgi:hypothetical protein
MRFLRFTFIFLSLSFHQLQAQISIDWKSREDLNILLPNSVRIYEGNGKLADSARVRAVYAKINLKDHHLTLQAKGSNPIRQTTLEAYQEHDGILAINGGYFSSTQSVSLLVSWRNHFSRPKPKGNAGCLWVSEWKTRNCMGLC